MTTDVVTVPETATLRDAVERLLTEDVGSVIVLSEEEHPVGIVTEEDALEAAYETGQPLDSIDVTDLSHKPVVTTKPSATVPYVASRMENKGVKKVPVMDDLDLVGIITLTDVVWALSDIRKEASALSEAKRRWDPEH